MSTHTTYAPSDKTRPLLRAIRYRSPVLRKLSNSKIVSFAIRSHLSMLTVSNAWGTMHIRDNLGGEWAFSPYRKVSYELLNNLMKDTIPEIPEEQPLGRQCTLYDTTADRVPLIKQSSYLRTITQVVDVSLTTLHESICALSLPEHRIVIRNQQKQGRFYNPLRSLQRQGFSLNAAGIDFVPNAPPTLPRGATACGMEERPNLK